MNIRRLQLQQMVIILLVTIFVCVYLVSWHITSLFINDADNVRESYSTVAEQKRKWNIVRYSDIVNWKLSNRSSSFEVHSVLLLSDDKRIYFHETAGRDHLNLRQLCAVESAAKKNPSRSVQFFFQTNHVNLTGDPLVSILRGYPNIAVILINVTDYYKRNPLPVYPLFLCPDIRILPKKYLYPYTFAHWKRFFRSNVNSDDRIFKSYAVHTYNKLSKEKPVFVRSNQLYSQIAKVHCPITYTHAISNLEIDYF